MIGMQHIDERNTAVPDWFVGYYDSGYFWVGVAVLSLLTVVLIVLALLRDERSATHPRRTRKGINKQNDR